MSYERPEPNFNPLPSHEGRPFCPLRHCPRPLFQSTPLMRGETSVALTINGEPLFQSAPLMRGETQAREAKNIWRLYFNPLPSCEGRPKDCFRRCSS